MNKELLIQAAWYVIYKARRKYIEIDLGNADPRIAQKINEIEYARCERVCSIMRKVIEKYTEVEKHE